MPLTVSKFIALVMLLLAVIIGVGSLSAFMVFLYAGSFNWVKLDLNEAQILLLNAFLSFIFFIQHSGMVRRSFRTRLSQLAPLYYQGVIYTIASGLVLSVFVIFWQGTESVVLEVQGWPSVLMRAMFFISIIGTGWGMWALRSVDMFGLDAVIKNQSNSPATAKSFSVRGPYRWVRHPLYLFTIVIFWSNPEITSDRLLFNIMWTIWVIVGTKLEERELIADFGDDYRNYQKTVPMLWPRSIHPVYPVNKQDIEM